MLVKNNNKKYNLFIALIALAVVISLVSVVYSYIYYGLENRDYYSTLELLSKLAVLPATASIILVGIISMVIIAQIAEKKFIRKLVVRDILLC